MSIYRHNEISVDVELRARESVIPLWKELEFYKEYQTKLRTYLGNQKANEILTEAVYVTSLGRNDFLENYYTLRDRRSQYTIEQFQVFLVGISRGFVKALFDLGARKISLGGVPPMGCLPLERTTNFREGNECLESYNVVSMQFNGKLKGLVGELNKELQGIKLVFSNPFYVFMQIVRRPSKYGKLGLILNFD
ncbi:hypothetical protein RHGRI_017995 [Rhododendron griersonianum]|uniref:GDSL esterase/lipase n=1 Tax=Rhododendron griersonianum TaxID=479676 RepID=A0AAV6JZX8_9ERIC|nr:hypothetical protein RHGRI_017995 [Rhododendron griersonianum]